MTDRIRIKQYEQAADEKVSIGGIKWQRKWDVCIQCDSREEAEAIRARLAQPEPEPVAWMHDSHVGFNVPLYTAPPQRDETPAKAVEWQGLTDGEIEKLYLGSFDEGQFARAIEDKLKEKNT